MPVLSAAPRRPLNPRLLQGVEGSGKVKRNIALAAGWRHYADFYEALRADRIRATPRMVQRLYRVADIVGFPKAELFLDEVAQ